MRKSTNTFSFEIPTGWQSFQDGARLVAQSPDGAEIIMSSWYVKTHPAPRPGELDGAVDQLFENARRSAQRAASHDELVITKDFGERPAVGAHFSCWTLLAETRDRQVFFGQAVLRAANAVMLVTFEAPFTVGREDEMCEVLASFGPGESVA